MKRDPDLIRRVMLAIEAIPAGQVVFGNQLGIDDVDDAVLAGHLLLLLDASFLEGQSHGGAFDGPSAETFVIVRLTSAGHDFLDAVRSAATGGCRERRIGKLLATIG